MVKQKAVFITVEGVEGVGKTTSLTIIREFLESKRIPVVLTREPGGTPVAESIRTLLLNSGPERLIPTTELLLVFAARAQHVHRIVKPALSRGNWVLCDRFIDSTYAYQGAGRGIPVEQINSLERMVLGDFRPDLTILLDLPVEVGLRRAAARSAKDRFESEDIDFFQRVRDAFLERAAMFSDRYCVVDAGESLDMVKTDIENKLEKYVSSI